MPLSARTRQQANEALLKQGMHSVLVQYPRTIFDSKLNWKSASHISPELKARNPRGYEDLARAQDLEDVMLYENWFYGVSNGIIIESGALDGYQLSTSWMFEQFAHWTAINIEANPPSFNLLKQNRPDSINIFAALCSEEKLLHYIDLGPLATRGFLELMNPEFIRKYHPQYISDKNIIEDYASMKCSKFSHIWRLLELKSVDLWILDVEGAELSVLQGVDFSEIDIRVIVMEANLNHPRSDQGALSLLETHGYHCDMVVRNYFCKHHSFRPSTIPVPPRLMKEGEGGGRRLNWVWESHGDNGEGVWRDLTPKLSTAVMVDALE